MRVGLLIETCSSYDNFAGMREALHITKPRESRSAALSRAGAAAERRAQQQPTNQADPPRKLEMDSLGGRVRPKPTAKAVAVTNARHATT